MDKESRLRSADNTRERKTARRTVPSILDILQAVQAVAPEASSVDAWWLGARSRLDVDASRDVGSRTQVELVVEGGPVSADGRAKLSSRLSSALRGASVTLRLAQSSSDTRSLFRLLTRRTGA